MFDAMSDLKHEEAHKSEEAVVNDMCSPGPKTRNTRKALNYLKLAMHGHRLTLHQGRGLTWKVVKEYLFHKGDSDAANKTFEARMAGYQWDWISFYTLVSDTCATIADDKGFNLFVNIIIIYVSIMAGLETISVVQEGYAPAKSSVETIIAIIFTFEVIIKILAEDESHLLYFKDSWNWLDLIVVIFSWAQFLPSNLVMMVRMIRLMRVLKLMKTLPELQNMAEAMFDGIFNVLTIGVLLFVYLVVAAAIGKELFGDNDPKRFGTIGDGMVTMFQCATFDAWADAFYTSAYGCAAYGYNEYECNNPKANFALAAASIAA